MIIAITMTTVAVVGTQWAPSYAFALASVRACFLDPYLRLSMLRCHCWWCYVAAGSAVIVGCLVAVYIIKSHASLIQNVVTCYMTRTLLRPNSKVSTLCYIILLTASRKMVEDANVDVDADDYDDDDDDDKGVVRSHN